MAARMAGGWVSRWVVAKERRRDRSMAEQMVDCWVFLMAVMRAVSMAQWWGMYWAAQTEKQKADL